MTRFHDPRASAIAKQIDTINATGWQSACDLARQNHAVEGGLSPVETVLRFDMFLAKSKDTADKRQSIWAEQVSQGISGIEWYTVEYGGVTVELPRLCEELTLVPGDKEILMQSKPVALDFLAHWNIAFKLWHYNREAESRWNQSWFCQFYAEYLHGEWLELWAEDEVSTVLLQDGTYNEVPTFAINACCCWGNPEAIHRTTAYSDSGSSWFQWNNFTPWK